MAGVYGRFERRGARIAGQEVQRCLDVLQSYGANGSDVFRKNQVAIGLVADWHRSEEYEHRIVHANQGSLHIAADIRLDNRRKIFDAIGEDGIRHDSCDAEYVLAAYKRWGKDCPKYLLGDFAFVIWDDLKSELYCARDVLGVRPLYYFWDSQRFVCATSIRAILATTNISNLMDEIRIADYLAVNFEDQERTFFEHIHRLPGGHCLTVNTDSIVKHPYFTLKLGRELRLRNSAEYADAFREILVEAVRTRVQGCSKVGLLLSGGLDSTSVAGILHELDFDREEPIPTFSAEFPSIPEANERRWMETALKIGNFDPNFVRVDQQSPLEKIEEDYRTQEEPFYAPNLRIDRMLLERAKERGVRVLIDGIDGDTTVGHGWEFLPELMRTGRWKALYRQLRELDHRSNRGMLWLFWHKALLSNLQNLRLNKLRVPPVLNTEFAGRIDYLDRMREQQKAQGVDRFSTYREHHFRALRSGLLSSAFQVEARQSAAFGIIRRHPYFDRNLVEFCLGLPSEQRMQGIDRMIQRRALQGLIPLSIQFRIGKADWSLAFEQNLWKKDRRYVDRMFQDFETISSYVDRRSLDLAYRACQNGWGNKEHYRAIWVAVTFYIWIVRQNAI